MTTVPTRTRDGFALPVALLAIMIIGALVTGGFYASSQEARISTSTDLANQAFYVAEYGLEEVIAVTSNTDLTTLRDALIADGTRHTDTVALAVPVVTGSDTLGSYSVRVRPLGSQMFLLTSDGEVTAGRRTARRSVGSVVRVTIADLPYPSALSVFGGLTTSGNSRVRGEDSGGPGCTAGASVAGVTAVDDALIDEGKKEHISGDPEVAVEPSLDTTALNDFGALRIEDLIAQATKIYEPGESENGMAPATVTAADGTVICDASVRSNWGDATATGPCADEVPIIYAKGDLHLKTGTGQGILIVDGDLNATGNFEFYGVVIVRGTLRTSGTGNHMEGSVIVKGGGELDSESLTTGNSLVQYSKCRVNKAFQEPLRPRRLDSRSWVDFTAITRGT